MTLPPDREIAARRSLDVVQQSAAKLERAIVRSIFEGRELSFSETMEIWREASLSIAQSRDIPQAAFGAVSRPNLTIAQAFPGVDSTHEFRTLVRGHVQNAADEVATITFHALSKGESPEKLARQLRPYVTGRDKTLPDGVAGEIIPVDQRGAAYSTEFNARRIAFSETHNARREAEVLHFQRDPLIELAQWTLSPNRGTQRQPDACDALAVLDWYGLGAGVFPLDAIPLSPHPFDRCETIPLVRSMAQLGREKVQGRRLRLDPWTVALPGQALMTPNYEERTRRTLAQILIQRPALMAA